MSGRYHHLFGPVRSRRLGLSLGLDLVPLKVCSFDCPYCQVGATTCKTVERLEYVPTAEILSEFEDWLATDGRADCVTLAGSGEPTLHSGFGEILAGIGSRSRFKRVLLSNGTLFWMPEVRAAAARADVVKGTLSAWDEESFQALHHPHASLTFDRFLKGLCDLRTVFGGEYWIEVFLVPGLNDKEEQVRRIALLAKEIHPDRIHLNTAVRPPADVAVRALSYERLAELASWFMPVAEVAASGRPADGASGGHVVGNLPERLCALVSRHPASAADLAASMAIDQASAEFILRQLVLEGRLKTDTRDGTVYYTGV
jgi:wyosine [tRNA(Phe)-imidazoG37] synthetase (radical SAM superfamily)